jgi:Phytanoyl-CoA dioxygenase (PhyH)
MKLAIPLEQAPEEPMFRSRFGGLWTDRRDAHQILTERKQTGRYSDVQADRLAQYIDHGYVIMPRAVDTGLIDEYVDFFERAWDELPPSVALISGGLTYPLSRDFYDRVAKVSCLHLYYPRAGELIFPPPVLEFLTDIYERPPVAFQTMSMRKGSEEPLHIDTGPLTLTEPMTLCASWVALEDVKPDSGEFEYAPGTHRVSERLHFGVAKGHDGDMKEYGQTLEFVHQQMDEHGLKAERFMAKKGDVLIWHGDLMHGGAKIVDPALTRMSLVAHFMPLGVMPNFYDFSNVNTYAYRDGGHCLDNIAPRKRRISRSQTPTTPLAPKTASPAVSRSHLRRLKDHVPLPMRTFVRQQADWLAHNPELTKRARANGSARE